MAHGQAALPGFIAEFGAIPALTSRLGPQGREALRGAWPPVARFAQSSNTAPHATARRTCRGRIVRCCALIFEVHWRTFAPPNSYLATRHDRPGAALAFLQQRQCALSLLGNCVEGLLGGGAKVGPYPTVTSQYSSTTLYQFSCHIRWLFFESDDRILPHAKGRPPLADAVLAHLVAAATRMLRPAGGSAAQGSSSRGRVCH
jgi:hypothetical protein